MFKIDPDTSKIQVPKELLNLNVHDITHKIMSEMVKLEEQVIISVIEQYTKQTFMIENASRIRRIFKQGVTDKYILAYDDATLGMIIYNQSNSTFKVEFIPGSNIKM